MPAARRKTADVSPSDTGEAASAYVTLLRAVNVGGRNLIAMAALKSLFEELRFADVKTLLQSGNVVFRHSKGPAEKLERDVEAALKRRLGLEIDCFVRDAREWDEALANNPFRREAKDDPARLVVMTLKSVPEPGALAQLRAAIKGPEKAELWQRTAYLHYPDGQGNSKLTPKIIESNLGTRGTARNWNTAEKLRAMLAN